MQEILAWFIPTYSLAERWGCSGKRLVEYFVYDGLLAYDKDLRPLPTVEDCVITVQYTKEEYLSYFAERIAYFNFEVVRNFELMHEIIPCNPEIAPPPLQDTLEPQRNTTPARRMTLREALDEYPEFQQDTIPTQKLTLQKAIAGYGGIPQPRNAPPAPATPSIQREIIEKRPEQETQSSQPQTPKRSRSSHDRIIAIEYAIVDIEQSRTNGKSISPHEAAILIRPKLTKQVQLRTIQNWIKKYFPKEAKKNGRPRKKK